LDFSLQRLKDAIPSHLFAYFVMALQLKRHQPGPALSCPTYKTTRHENPFK